MEQTKPFDISKRQVWEAYHRPKTGLVGNQEKQATEGT